MASIVMPSVAAGTQHICRAQLSSCSIGGNSRPCCSRSSAWTADAFGRRLFGLSSRPQNRVLRLSTRSQSDPQFSVSDVNLGAEPQIILPNVNTPDYLYGEKQLSKAVDEDSEDSSEDEEDQDDSWLLEFQNEVERIKQTWSDVESMKDSWNHVSDYSGMPRNTTRRRVLGAPMFMSLAFVFGWAAPERKAYAVKQPAKIDLTTAPTSAQFDAGDERLQKAAAVFRQALEATTVVTHSSFKRNKVLPPWH